MIGVALRASCHRRPQPTKQTPFNETRVRNQTAAKIALDRRSVLISTGVLGVVSAFEIPKAAAEECELTESPSGILFCDVEVGQGDTPIEGTLIR